MTEHATQGGCTFLGDSVICMPRSMTLRRVSFCPTCRCRRRFVGLVSVWYDTLWTCCGCGDSFSPEGRMQRPFARGWRKEATAYARKKWAEAPPARDVRRWLHAELDLYREDAA